MRLAIHGRDVRIKQMAHDFLIVDAEQDIPTGVGEITLIVDDSIDKWKVSLPHGIQRGHERVYIEPCFQE